MFHLLFCSPAPCDLGRVAAALARQRAHDSWAISFRSVGQEKKKDAERDAIYREQGFDFSGISPFTAHETESIKFQVVVSISPPGTDYVPTFSGMPVHIHWALDDETAGFGSPTEFARLVHDLKQRVDRLFQEGILDSVAQVRSSLGALIENLTEGVMAHDRHRRIFIFNRAAEIITGCLARDVIGRDCHVVFSGKFCGGDCSFCDDESKPAIPMGKIRFPTTFTRHNGVTRDLEMSTVSLDNPDTGLVACLVIFRDTTEINKLRRTVRRGKGYHGLIGKHPSMQKVFDSISELCRVDVPILIQGESGTGKEMVAKALHVTGERAEKPFVPVNCGALPEGTLESELFGHVRGAFTGAIRDRKGRFELAHTGTLFLDEIGEISPTMQVNLLRVLQENSFVPVGGEKTIFTDVRVICASNKNLKKATTKGAFREDLYYRIAGVPIQMPPLRERKSDIPLLVDHYIEQFSNEMGADGLDVDPEAIDLLLNHNWPGNVRELRNAVQYAMIKSHSGKIFSRHLPPEILESMAGNGLISIRSGRPEKLTREIALETLKRFDGNKAKTARHLGVSRTTLYRAISRKRKTD